jgi:hypothetical protein
MWGKMALHAHETVSMHFPSVAAFTVGAAYALGSRVGDAIWPPL